MYSEIPCESMSHLCINQGSEYIGGSYNVNRRAKFPVQFRLEKSIEYRPCRGETMFGVSLAVLGDGKLRAGHCELLVFLYHLQRA